MKYKLLAEKGMHFLCIGDGRAIPRQTKTTVKQSQRECALVEVSAIGYPGDDEGLVYDGKRLLFKDVELTGLLSLDIDANLKEHVHVFTFNFSVHADVGDSSEVPKRDFKLLGSAMPAR